MKSINQMAKLILVGLLSLSSLVALSACHQNISESSSKPATENSATESQPASTASSGVAGTTAAAPATAPAAGLKTATTATTTPTTPGMATPGMATPGMATPGMATAPDSKATSTDTPSATATTAAATDAGKTNVVDLAASSGEFTTLAKAIEAAGLTDTLKAAGPYTVFAPTDAAFAALPAGTLDKLLLPENKETLKKVLTYHVLQGQVISQDIKPGDVATVEGNTVKVEQTGSEVKVNDATVTKPDLQASNGVIHAIDKVIIPPDVKATLESGSPSN